jgi:endonuclease III
MRAIRSKRGHAVKPGPVPAIVARLEKVYGPRPWKYGGDPLGGLIATILSQHTSDTNSDAAYASLRRRFPSWKSVLKASPRQLEEAIRCGGLARQKARFIQDLLRKLQAERGRLSLAFLADSSAEEALDFLCGFKGVGPKTAACVLLFNLGKPVLPVDTHIHRLSKRLGLIGPNTSADEAHDRLQLLCPGEMVYAFHVLMITHGRQTCRAQNPLCRSCCLNDVCPVGRARLGVEALLDV